MAIEGARGCGYRICGALYLVSDGIRRWCGRLPLPTSLPQSRQFQLHPLVELLADGEHKLCHREGCTLGGARFTCPLRWPPAIDPTTQVGLSWVGDRHYTVASFTLEVAEMGVSKRVPGIPSGLELGRSWVLLAHPRAYTYRDGDPASHPSLADRLAPCGCGITAAERYPPECPADDPNHPLGHGFQGPGFFHAFIPQRVECLVEDDRLDEEWVSDLKAKGVTIIPVPADDPDHARGTTSYERGDDAGNSGPERPDGRDGLQEGRRRER